MKKLWRKIWNILSCGYAPHDKEPTAPLVEDHKRVNFTSVDSSDVSTNTYPSANVGRDISGISTLRRYPIVQKVRLVMNLFDGVLVPTSHELAMRVRLKKLIEVQPIEVEDPFNAMAKMQETYLTLPAEGGVRFPRMFPNLVRLKFTYAITTTEEREMFLKHSDNYFQLTQEVLLRGNEGILFCLLFSHHNDDTGEVMRAGMLKDAAILGINIPDMSLKSHDMSFGSIGLEFVEVTICGIFTEEPDHITKAQNYIRPPSKKVTSWRESAQNPKSFPLNNQG